MQVERDGDTIRYQCKDNDSGQVIGGAVASIRMERVADEKEVERYLTYCAERIQPRECTIQEVIRWAEENWDLESLPSDHHRMAATRANIACNRFPDRYGQPNITAEMSDAEIERRILQGHAQRAAAMDASDEALGIRLRGYRLPDTPRNQPLYQQGYAEFRAHMKEHHADHPMLSLAAEEQAPKADAHLFIEELEGDVSGSDVGSAPLVRMLAIRLGLSANDITSRNRKFMGYVHLLTEDGQLPTLKEFLAGQQK